MVLFSSGQKVGCIFSIDIAILNGVNTLVKSSETEASSAGEQLVRDSLITDKKVN